MEEHWRKGHGVRRETAAKSQLEEARKQAEALRKASEAKRQAPGPTGATPDATRRRGAAWRRTPREAQDGAVFPGTEALLALPAKIPAIPARFKLET